MNSPRRFLLLAVAAICAPLSSPAEHHEGPPRLETIEVAPNLFMFTGVGGFTGGNIGVSVGPDGVVVIDDSMPPFLDQLQTRLADVTDQPITFLINTHLHGDHTGNNAALAESGARIVAHEQMRSRLLADPKSDPAAIPVITFTEEMTFHLNDQPARLMHAPAAHTDGDAIILFPLANVVHTGDTYFHHLFPFIDLDNGGSVAGYIAAQERILSLADDDTKIIPGHGPLATQADLTRDLTMLKDARNLVVEMIAAGHDIDAILAANPLAKYHDDYNWGFISTERMTRTLHRDLTGK